MLIGDVKLNLLKQKKWSTYVSVVDRLYSSMPSIPDCLNRPALRLWGIAALALRLLHSLSSSSGASHATSCSLRCSVRKIVSASSSEKFFTLFVVFAQNETESGVFLRNARKGSCKPSAQAAFRCRCAAENAWSAKQCFNPY